jgi:hypothetical protein
MTEPLNSEIAGKLRAAADLLQQQDVNWQCQRKTA